jgi:hypothetical protein
MNGEMDAQILKRCINITEMLTKLPCARLFSVPVDPALAPNYLQVIRRPMDLSTVLRRLKAGTCHDVKKWERDIRLILQNCRTYNTDESILTVLAKELIVHFEKMLKKFRARESLQGWADRYCKLSTKLDNLLAAHPRSGFLPQLEVFDDLKKVEARETVAPPPIENLGEELGKLTSKEHQIQLLLLLKKFEPEICENKNDIEISLTELKRETIAELTRYVTQHKQKDRVR